MVAAQALRLGRPSRGGEEGRPRRGEEEIRGDLVEVVRHRLGKRARLLLQRGELPRDRRHHRSVFNRGLDPKVERVAALVGYRWQECVVHIGVRAVAVEGHVEHGRNPVRGWARRPRNRRLCLTHLPRPKAHDDADPPARPAASRLADSELRRVVRYHSAIHKHLPSSLDGREEARRRCRGEDKILDRPVRLPVDRSGIGVGARASRSGRLATGIGELIVAHQEGLPPSTLVERGDDRYVRRRRGAGLARWRRSRSGVGPMSPGGCARLSDLASGGTRALVPRHQQVCFAPLLKHLPHALEAGTVIPATLP
mmetsp:Transcript_18026/g.53421  ORF Transcript_18026/g.53421 Transcript_18026/m.53421 type:complete len:311 (-) Transcript_18026:338-1270(-)